MHLLAQRLPVSLQSSRDAAKLETASGMKTEECLNPSRQVREKATEPLATGNKIIFLLDQLAEIRKSSLAALICENADSIGKIQPLAFLRPGGWNAKVPCDQIAKMNLNVFKNEKLWNE